MAKASIERNIYVLQGSHIKKTKLCQLLPETKKLEFVLYCSSKGNITRKNLFMKQI